MTTKAEKAAMKAHPPKFVTPKRWAKRVQSEKVDTHAPTRAIYRYGYEQAEEDIISLIESRIGEIIGDAQPAPILRAELRELIKRIKH